jgi:hypothetical protein
MFARMNLVDFKVQPSHISQMMKLISCYTEYCMLEDVLKKDAIKNETTSIIITYISMAVVKT